MVYSMTGFGTAQLEGSEFTVNVEVKTLNSKFLDVNLRFPKFLNEKEIVLRNLVSDHLQRGKVNLSIDCSLKEQASQRVIFQEKLFEHYYEDLKKLAQRVGGNEQDIFRLALQMPEVQQSQEQHLNGALWEKVMDVVQQALQECNTFRQDEGKKLQELLLGYNTAIATQLEKVKGMEKQRMQRIRERITGNLAQVVEEEGLDKQRLEQELVYYMEKLDVTEEIARLGNHLDYFEKTLKKAELPHGKKLGFISQEMGREINTLGSKANDAEMQRYVVEMKEELEKIKEQVLNVL